MIWRQLLAVITATCVVSVSLTGCTTSSTPATPSTAKPQPPQNASTTPQPESGEATNNGEMSSTKETSTETPATSTATTAAAKDGFWEDYPDVPKLEIMTEVNGIKIPRQPLKGDTLQVVGKLPVDVGNDHAKKKPSEPTTGDTLTIRFNSEPKVLNSITESSAVQHYIIEYVNEGLARQNPETFEYEPHIASKWVVEDSVKLSPDYPGKERRIAMEGQAPAPTLEIDYTAPLPPTDGGKPDEPPTIILTTSNKEGEAVGGVWVGVFPIGKIVGASTTGYHFWSDAAGKAKISAFPTGKYAVKIGAEVYGKVERADNGAIKVTPATDENPLHETIKSSGEPALTLKAGEWTDVQEQTYYTYYLRDDVKWSDGASFTTRDIEFGYSLLNNEFVDGDSIRTYYSDLIECQSFGPQVVRMRYRQQYFKAFEFTYGISVYSPSFEFFAKIFREQGKELTLQRLSVDEEKAQNKVSVHGQEFGKFFNTDDRHNRSPLGTGPYVIDKWVSKDRVELTRNPNYWNPKLAGHVDRIIVKFIPDQVSAMAALKAGEIDFFYNMTAEQFFQDWPNVDAAIRENYVQASWYSPMFGYFGWNQLAPQFQDRRVRIALGLLFDRQDFVDTKLHGEAIVVSGTQYYFGPGYDQKVAPLGYDPEIARDLLENAGWIDSDNDGILDKDGVKFQVTLRLPPGNPIAIQRCEVLQKNAKSVGIDLQIQLLEWASFIEKVRAKECDVITLSWAMPIESDPFQIWHSSEAGRHKRGSNSISFANPQADALIEMLRVTLDEKKRQRIHWTFHRLLDSEQPYMFLWIPKEFGVYHKRFRNVKWYRLRPGFDLSEWYVPKDEQLH